MTKDQITAEPLYAIAQPVEVQRVPLTNNAVIKIIHEKHFDKNYQLSQSDRNLLDWYRVGLRDGKQAHGIKPAMKEPK